MPLTENDLIRIRQFIQKLEAGLVDGLSVFITYHDADLDAMPSNPTGDGTTGGWHTDSTENVNWMSTKRAHHVTEGTWGDPMAIRGLTGDTGATGDDAVVYYIKPTDGTAIKNGTGTLTIEAHQIAGSVDTKLSSGTIKLYDPSNNEVTVANGYAAGSDGYTGVFDAGDINLSKVITMKDGPAGAALDTITLIDILDGEDGAAGENGADGDDAIIGSIESDIGLVWLQAPGPGAWTPAGTECTLTVKYYQGGAQINTRTVVITRSGATLTAPGPDTVDGITYSRLGNSTSALTILFTHVASDIQVAETVYAIAGSTSSGGGLSDDVPLLRNITFIGSVGSGKVGWTTGYLDYGGSTYTITVKPVDDGSTDAYIYWDADDSNTTFKTTGTLATAIGEGNWLVCKNDSGVAIPAETYRLLLGGLIQASTITAAHILVANLAAINAALGNITSGELLLTHSDTTRKFRLNNLGLYVSNNGTDFIPVLYNDGGVIKLDAGQIKVGTLLADRISSASLTGITAQNFGYLANLGSIGATRLGGGGWTPWSNSYQIKVENDEIEAGAVQILDSDAADAQGQHELWGLKSGGDKAVVADYDVQIGSTTSVNKTTMRVKFNATITAENCPGGYLLIRARAYSAAGNAHCSSTNSLYGDFGSSLSK